MTLHNLLFITEARGLSLRAGTELWRLKRAVPSSLNCFLFHIRAIVFISGSTPTLWLWESHLRYWSTKHHLRASLSSSLNDGLVSCAGKIPLSCLVHDISYESSWAKANLIWLQYKNPFVCAILFKWFNSFLFPFCRRSWRWAASYIHQSVHLWCALAVSSLGSAGGCNPDSATCPFPCK